MACEWEKLLLLILASLDKIVGQYLSGGISMENDEILNTLITELSERALKECRNNNIEVEKKIGDLVALSELVQNHLRQCDDQVKQDFENYINLMNNIFEIQQKYLYIQGAKDCAGLLKSLNLI